VLRFAYIYIYIYIYVCVCACVSRCVELLLFLFLLFWFNVSFLSLIYLRTKSDRCTEIRVLWISPSANKAGVIPRYVKDPIRTHSTRYVV
jgi:hypothetical protein